MAHALQHLRRHRAAHRAAGAAASRPADRFCRADSHVDRRPTGCSRSFSTPTSSSSRASCRRRTLAAQERLLLFIQFNRLLLLVAMGAAVWFGRGTDWRLTYLRLAVGVGIGFVLRLGTNQAIAHGEYQVGSFHDLAWIAPWLCYAWAAAEAPASPEPATQPDDQHEALAVAAGRAPALLIPLIGYGVLNLESAGEPLDSIRLFLTSLTTVVGAGDRDAAAGRAGDRTAAGRRAAAAARRGDRAYRRPDSDHAAGRDVRTRQSSISARARLLARRAGRR